jgi:hypothetical protein
MAAALAWARDYGDWHESDGNGAWRGGGVTPDGVLVASRLILRA